MRTLANSEDPDEMPHCLLSPKQSSYKEIQYYFEVITCDTSIYTIDHPIFIVSNQKKEAISTQRVKIQWYLKST